MCGSPGKEWPVLEEVGMGQCRGRLEAQFWIPKHFWAGVVPSHGFSVTVVYGRQIFKRLRKQLVGGLGGHGALRDERRVWKKLGPAESDGAFLEPSYLPVHALKLYLWGSGAKEFFQT
jgi:hypothetical protein